MTVAILYKGELGLFIPTGAIVLAFFALNSFLGAFFASQIRKKKA